MVDESSIEEGSQPPSRGRHRCKILHASELLLECIGSGTFYNTLQITLGVRGPRGFVHLKTDFGHSGEDLGSF